MSIHFTPKKKRNLNSSINVTPLIDVMLVLLVIFMVTAPMMKTNIKVTLPMSSTKDTKSKSTEKQEVIEISIDQSNKIFLNNAFIAINELDVRVKALSEYLKTSEIHLYADQSVDYGKVVAVMNKLQLAGFNKIMLMTQNKQQTKTNNTKHKN